MCQTDRKRAEDVGERADEAAVRGRKTDVRGGGLERCRFFMRSGQTGGCRVARAEKEGERVSFDFKKEYKDLYMPKCAPVQITVPPQRFFCVRGEGDPNVSEDYKRAIEILYGLSFTVKMSKMGQEQPAGYFDYVVPPLEGFWWSQAGERADSLLDKNRLCWLSVIRQPEFVDENVFVWAREKFRKKKPGLDLSAAEYRVIEEGLCVQALHIGSYDDEIDSFARIDELIKANGWRRRGIAHHEIYLTDPRRTAKEKWKMVLRVPVEVCDPK